VVVLNDEHPVGGCTVGVRTKKDRYVMVLEAYLGFRQSFWKSTQLQHQQIARTKQWGLLVGSEQDSILGKDQTQGAW